MKICAEYFSDETLKDVVRSGGSKGICDICKKSSDYVYDTECDDNTLTAYFDLILRLYQPYDEVNDSREIRGNAQLLQNFVKKKWNLFADNVRDMDINQALMSICPDMYEMNKDLFNKAVYLRRAYDEQYLKEHVLLKTHTWKEFSDNIIEVNRFHSKYINLDILEKYMGYLKVSYGKGTTFFRSRICESEAIHSEDMGAPPKDKARDSRASAIGIRCLYLGDSVETTLYEVRAAKYDNVSVGEFKLKDDISVVDLTRLKSISPFIMPESDIEEFAVNLEQLEYLDNAMGKPVRHSDSSLDYVPTQYIADFIKSITDDDGRPVFQGIQYRSVMKSGGFNLAIFDPELFECINVTLKQIDEIHYHTH